MQNARFQIYTGEGKGKTTCALGLALRGLGYGWKVYFGQFLKDTETGESRLLSAMEGVTFQQFGSGRSLLPGVRAEDVDRECALRGLECIKHALTSGEYDLVVADEINMSWVLGMLTEEEWLECAQARTPSTELVFTGRGLPPCAREEADLITEMREIKHYYHAGVFAREGIDY